jgi:hypothetical protein
MCVEVGETEGCGRGVFALRSFVTGERIRIVNIEREVTEAHPLGPEDNPDHNVVVERQRLASSISL